MFGIFSKSSMIRPTPLFVSFYTPDYARAAGRLMESLRKFKLEHEVVPTDDTGRWVLNCGKKPQFIWNMISANPNRPIVWLDADCEIKRTPRILLNRRLEDIAVCRYVWRKARKPELFSGTVYFNCTPAARKVVDRWIEFQDGKPETWDQAVLREAIEAVPEVQLYSLPVGYCFIFDFHRQEHPGAKPVIEHYQRSRIARPAKQ